MDIQELETELTELRTKIESYAAEMWTPLANAITWEEEELVVNLGRRGRKICWRSICCSCIRWAFVSCDTGILFILIFLVFAIQKCDPTHFYLFDEVCTVRLVSWIACQITSRSMPTWMPSIGRL
jgi:uncharacterized integral membrane protein